jgi:O-methyltransferase
LSFDTLQPIWVEIPGFFRKNSYQDIFDLTNNPTLAKYGSNFFEQLAQDPRREADFATAMKIQETVPESTFPPFPYEAAIPDFETESKNSGSDVFLVDVGGGQGQYLDRLLKSHASLPGRKIVQDLPTVIAGVDPSITTFESMTHDFFTSQPIKGAKYYHLRGIMHDWPDKECIKIISQLRDVFKPGYSRLLIHTIIMPEKGCPLWESMQDINMWTCCGVERTESQWRLLLQEVGMELLQIFRAETGLYGIIEADLVK